jgi:3-isopropylmalate dehydrogenase
MKFRIATVPGDGIGPDITQQGILVLEAIGKKYGHEFTFTEVLAGGSALDAYGVPLPAET